MFAIHEVCREFGLKISVKNTKVISLDIYGHQTLNMKLDEDVLKHVDKFHYLGSTIT